jgi:hypothetical protein
MALDTSVRPCDSKKKRVDNRRSDHSKPSICLLALLLLLFLSPPLLLDINGASASRHSRHIDHFRRTVLTLQLARRPDRTAIPEKELRLGDLDGPGTSSKPRCFNGHRPIGTAGRGSIETLTIIEHARPCVCLLLRLRSRFFSRWLVGCCVLLVLLALTASLHLPILLVHPPGAGFTAEGGHEFFARSCMHMLPSPSLDSSSPLHSWTLAPSLGSSTSHILSAGPSHSNQLPWLTSNPVATIHITFGSTYTIQPGLSLLYSIGYLLTPTLPPLW